MSTSSVTAFAPASVGNVAVGFDILGHALSGIGDRVRVTFSPESGVRIRPIEGLPVDLPLEPENNTAGRAVLDLLEQLGITAGLELTIDKGIPLASGLGGSAASAVAAVVASNALLDLNLSAHELYPFALAGEAIASGSAHGDNIAPQLLGGLVLVAGEDLISLPVPEGLTAVAVHPHCQVATAQARQKLREPFPLDVITAQSTNLARVLAGCYQNDIGLLAQGLNDHMIEPRRATLIPGFVDVKQAALNAGALGAAISGAGPTVCAWFDGDERTQFAANAMQQAFQQAGLDSDVVISAVNCTAAHIEQVD
ncbi:MAG: homoserine kinase [Pseudomonadota bacterium]